jgi:hypothetical protein
VTVAGVYGLLKLFLIYDISFNNLQIPFSFARLTVTFTLMQIKQFFLFLYYEMLIFLFMHFSNVYITFHIAIMLFTIKRVSRYLKI